MELWDKDYLDMVEPACIQFKANGLSEFKFGEIGFRLGDESTFKAQK